MEKLIKNNEYDKAEELSQCLDSLIDSKCSITVDEGIKELVELAAFVKKSYRQEELPRALIDEIVDNLANELQAKKKKRRHWLYSGIAGTAAAVIITAFTQLLLPQSADHNIAQQVDDRIDTKEMAVSSDKPSNTIIAKSAEIITDQQTQFKENTKVPMTVALEEKSAVSKVLAEIINAANPLQVDQKHTQVAILKEESARDKIVEKGAYMAKVANSPLKEERSMQQGRKIARVITIPNQAAQSIKVDIESGDIKQVYNMGTHDEIIITQVLSDEGRADIEGPKQVEVQTLTEGGAMQPFSKKTKYKMNSLRVKVNHYDVVIEGKKTSEELQKIAESLIEKEIEY